MVRDEMQRVVIIKDREPPPPAPRNSSFSYRYEEFPRKIVSAWNLETKSS